MSAFAKNSILPNYKDAESCAAESAAYAKIDAKKAASVVSHMPAVDAPIVGISQSVNFVVTFGGSLSPTWMLTVWRGPTAALSAQGIRTHTLDIAIGPRPSDQNAAIQTLQQNRLISAVSR